ncbi:MAG: DNA repair protein RecN [Clostridia bacterium]
MLRQLSICNVALIDQLDIRFYDGFSVLTGETGAGKSIIIEALNFVLGERASRELIQSGAQKASVEATFVLPEYDCIRSLLSELELAPEDDTLVLYRELSVGGKNICRANGTLISAAILKQIGDALVDIHGQHAHQSLLNPKLHIGMLDDFAGSVVTPVKQRVFNSYHRAVLAGKQLRSAETDERERERRCDLIAYQMKEIDDANLTDGEEEELNEQRKLLQNAQIIMESLEGSTEALTGDDHILPELSVVLHSLDIISAFHKDYADVAERLHEAYYTIEDIAYTIRDLRNDFSFEPETLDQIEWRLELISTLKRKYGASITEILKYRSKIDAEYELLASSEERREELQRTYEALLNEYTIATNELTVLRKEAAMCLRERLLPELIDLGMAHASFEVAFERLQGEIPSEDGVDHVEFLLSANRGEPLKSLSRVASGGELSRIMLSFKSVLADSDEIPTMVFDEIDTGISGQIGTAVAVKMRQIAKRHQVLCITHLPQIAAFANRQYLVFKQTENERTTSHATLLSEDERVCEIAHIMGSGDEDPVALQHARQLIASANEHP